MEHLPNLFLAEIQYCHFFVVDLPVTAFGFQDTMVIRLSIEYGESNPGKYGAHIWACEKYSTIKHLVWSIEIQICEDADEAILAALNKDAGFYDAMCDYIDEAAKHRVFE